MAGIIILIILGLWFFFSKFLSGLLTTNLKPGGLKIVLRFLVFSLILTAPVADEIIGGFQFRALCEENDNLIYDAKNIRNKTLLYSPLSRKHIENTIIPIAETVTSGMDVSTNEIVLKYKTYRATGGWLSRAIAFNSVTKPHTFNGVCGVKDKLYKLENKLNIKPTYK